MPKVKETYTEEKKQYILQCTTDVLKEKHIHKLTMRDIIRKTGFSQGTIYQYYRNLEQILNVLILNYMHRMKEEIEASICEKQDFYQCYEAVCECMVRLYEESPVMFEAVLGTVAFSKEENPEDEVLYEIYLAGEQLSEMIIRLLKNGMKNGIVEEDLNLHVAVFYLWSSIGQAILFSSKKKDYIFQQFGLDDREYRRLSFEMIIKSVKNGEKQCE